LTTNVVHFCEMVVQVTMAGNNSYLAHLRSCKRQSIMLAMKNVPWTWWTVKPRVKINEGRHSVSVISYSSMLSSGENIHHLNDTE